MKLARVCDKIIEYSFYLLFFLTPLVLTPLNYELFEFNKLMFVYVVAAIILTFWLMRGVIEGEIRIRRTPLDSPLLLFLASQIISTIFSIDRHVSIWGYYSRFHGSLLSTIAYIALYYILVSTFNKEKILLLLRYALFGGVIVAGYGTAEHFGIDAQYWVQDVRNRVFSTLGQPNWLAAYTSVLIPIAIAFGIQNSVSQTKTGDKYQISSIKYYLSKKNFLPIIYYLLLITFYLALLYTRSRSGFLGFWGGNLIFWGILLLKFRGGILKWFLIVNCTFLIINFFAGSPFEQINKYFSLSAITTNGSTAPIAPPPPGGTESGEIRKIVWKGAVDIFKHYPIFGSGVETFAFSYYQFRPVEHNLTSEWDFLYNKAHNEYLNFLATTGSFGLGTYLLLIGWFIAWNLKSIIYHLKFKNHKYEIIDDKYYLLLALFAAYISILVSNFFGFSVVIVGLFFFLIPAFSFIASEKPNRQIAWSVPLVHNQNSLGATQWILMAVVFVIFLYGVTSLVRFWIADVYFANGYNLNQSENYQEAYPALQTAISLRSGEPFYHDELAWSASALAAELAQEKEATLAAIFADEAIRESDHALKTSPKNVSFWKTRTKVFYSLSEIDESYNQEALKAILEAQKLAPTDAKIAYNLAILHGRVGDEQMAVKTLEETVRLKSDYRDARFALALYLDLKGKRKEAADELKYILEKITPNDEQSMEKLREWGEKI